MTIRPLLAVSAATAVLIGSAGLATASDTSKSGVERLPAALRSALTTPPDGTLAATDVLGQSTLRMSGSDRYETSVAISEMSWDDSSTMVVYLASGENYPDALSVGASTNGLGPLLLTRRDSLPQPVANELARLRPCLVIIAGGTGSVSDAVALEADSYADPASCEL